MVVLLCSGEVNHFFLFFFYILPPFLTEEMKEG